MVRHQEYDRRGGLYFVPHVPRNRLPRAANPGGVNGSPSLPTEEYNLETRATVDEKITEHTVDFIRRNGSTGQPLFTYVSFTHIHPPYRYHPDFKGKPGGGKYSDMLAEIDCRSGQILDALDEAGIAQDTIVVWSSDNATAVAGGLGGSNGPWRGVFGSGFEGGLRVPALVRRPGKVTAGAVNNEPLATYDWLPTLAALAGEADRVPCDRPIDGVDASDLLLGRSETSNRDHLIYYGSDGEVMSAKWKSIKVVFRYADTFHGPIVKPQFPMAFGLTDDRGEQTNLTRERKDMMWMFGPAIQRLIALEQSFAEYPNLQPGQEFNGYE